MQLRRYPVPNLSKSCSEESQQHRVLLSRGMRAGGPRVGPGSQWAAGPSAGPCLTLRNPANLCSFGLRFPTKKAGSVPRASADHGPGLGQVGILSAIKVSPKNATSVTRKVIHGKPVIAPCEISSTILHNSKPRDRLPGPQKLQPPRSQTSHSPTVRHTMGAPAGI